MEIIGQKAVLDDGPDEEDMTDRDLASPQFVSWSARREVRLLRDVIKTLAPTHVVMADLLARADDAVRLVDDIDNAIDHYTG